MKQHIQIVSVGALSSARIAIEIEFYKQHIQIVSVGALSSARIAIEIEFYNTGGWV